MSKGVSKAIDTVASTPIVASVVQASPIGILAETGALGSEAQDRLGVSKTFGKDPFGTKGKAKEKQDAIEALKKLETSTTTVRDPTETITTGESSSTSQKTFDPQSQLELNLNAQGRAQFQGAVNLNNRLESGLGAATTVQNNSLGTLNNVLDGSAFDVNDSERRRIDNIRQSQIDVGSNEINKFLTERLGQLDADLARRGVRGQAASQLQGDQVGLAAQSLQERILAANQSAAGLEVSLPGQRVGQQSAVALQGSSLADNKTQNALNNRLKLQTPEELAAIRKERLAGGKTTTTGTSSQLSTTTGGGSKTTSVGGGAAQAIMNAANAPSTQAENIAIIGGLAGTGAKIAGAVNGAG